jgi:hypothetical protein
MRETLGSYLVRAPDKSPLDSRLNRGICEEFVVNCVHPARRSCALTVASFIENLRKLLSNRSPDRDQTWSHLASAVSDQCVCQVLQDGTVLQAEGLHHG